MCSHYESVTDSERLRLFFGVDAPHEHRGTPKQDVWPKAMSVFVHQDTTGARVADVGSFGLVPHWATDPSIGRSTYNARSETVATKPSFRQAWAQSRRCIVPAQAIYEPDWSSGRAVAARIGMPTGEPFGIAGLWSSWRGLGGVMLPSFTMLTVNAVHHPLMRRFHKPVDEKRMVVILRPDQYRHWLTASVEEASWLLYNWSNPPLEVLDPLVEAR